MIRQNHMGDWGTPFGMLIEHLIDVGEGRPRPASSSRDLECASIRRPAAKFDG